MDFCSTYFNLVKSCKLKFGNLSTALRPCDALLIRAKSMIHWVARCVCCSSLVLQDDLKTNKQNNILSKQCTWNLQNSMSWLTGIIHPEYKTTWASCIVILFQAQCKNGPYLMFSQSWEVLGPSRWGRDGRWTKDTPISTDMVSPTTKTTTAWLRMTPISSFSGGKQLLDKNGNLVNSEEECV